MAHTLLPAGSTWKLVVETRREEIVFTEEAPKEILNLTIQVGGELSGQWCSAVSSLRSLISVGMTDESRDDVVEGGEMTVGEVLLSALLTGLDSDGFVKSILAHYTGIEENDIRGVKVVLGMDLSSESCTDVTRSVRRCGK